MRKLLALLAVLLLGAGAAFADDTVTLVLGTGSPTGTVTAASPAASGVGKWVQAVGVKENDTFLAFQLSGGATATIVIQATLDESTTDTVYTFAASGEIFTVAVPGGTRFRAVCTSFGSGSPIVTASASGKAQVKVYP